MRREDVSAELLEDVKNELGVTWNDEATDNLYRGFIARAFDSLAKVLFLYNLLLLKFLLQQSQLSLHALKFI